MRFEQQISACFRAAAATGLCGYLFAFVGAVSAFGQQPAPQTTPAQQVISATPQTGNVLRLSQDDAVKLGLENNLGLSAEQLTPQIQTYAVAGAKSAYAPTLLSSLSKNSNTNPPGNFLTGSGNVLTNEGFRTSAGLQQLVPWGGGRYTVGWDGSRVTTSDASSRFNPQLDSGFDFQVVQPLLRNFWIDSTRQNVMISQTRQQIADLQLRQTATQTSRNVRIAYFNLVNAIARLAVDQQSLDLARQSLLKQQAEGRGRDAGADRHRRSRGGSGAA